MQQVYCSGSPREIGYTHGRQAKDRVHGSISFYRALFQERCGMDWDEVLREAGKYAGPLRSTCARYLDEVEALADGAGVRFLDILAINIRSEIMFGLFTEPTRPQHADVPSDGCTSIGWLDRQSGHSFLAQNWDWHSGQQAHLILCHVASSDPEIPSFSMVTEAGIIGKIGFNANGVGCCLNAIRARGVDATKLPVKFALRIILESPSRAAAIARLAALGVAGSSHILVGDATGSTGLECHPLGIKEIRMDPEGRVYHTNHLVLPHDGVDESVWLQDSQVRLARVKELAETTMAAQGSVAGLLEILKDESGYPCSINRKHEAESTSQTLFTIIADLTHRKGFVQVGRPTEGGERILFAYQEGNMVERLSDDDAIC